MTQAPNVVKVVNQRYMRYNVNHVMMPNGVISLRFEELDTEGLDRTNPVFHKRIKSKKWFAPITLLQFSIAIAKKETIVPWTNF